MIAFARMNPPCFSVYGINLHKPALIDAGGTNGISVLVMVFGKLAQGNGFAELTKLSQRLGLPQLKPLATGNIRITKSQPVPSVGAAAIVLPYFFPGMGVVAYGTEKRNHVNCTNGFFPLKRI